MQPFYVWLMYKSVVILVGLVCVILGYKLLMRGIFPSNSEIVVGWDENKKLVLKRASPGIIFALIGFGIIGLSVGFGAYTETNVASGSSATKQVNADNPNEKDIPPNERWKYIKATDSKGIQNGQLTNEQKELLRQMQEDMQKAPVK